MNLHDIQPILDTSIYTRHDWLSFRITSLTSHTDSPLNGFALACGTINRFYLSDNSCYEDFEVPLPIFNMALDGYSSNDITYFNDQIQADGYWNCDITGRTLANHLRAANQ
jgi:hypothetical protein